MTGKLPLRAPRAFYQYVLVGIKEGPVPSSTARE